MRTNIGNPVTGEDFFDREREQTEIWRKLGTNHLLMLAPRRIGKTSLMLRLCATADEHDFSASMASVAACEDEMGCVKELISAAGKNGRIAERFRQALTDALKHVKNLRFTWGEAEGSIEFHSEGTPDWRQVGEALTQSLAGLEHLHLLCVDELPIFVLTLLGQKGGRDRVRAFLNWFRNLRQVHHAKVRWIIAGSIGLDTVASRLRLGDTINDLDLFPLDAFTEDCANRYLAALAESYGLGLDPSVRRYMIQRVGWPVPYYLALLFEQTLIQGGRAARIDAAAVDMAFESLLAPAFKGYFDYWRQRLHEELGQPEAGHALVLLGAACRDEQGASRTVFGQHLANRVAAPEHREELLRYLLDVLENDGYFIKQEDRYRFRLEWLRQYWLRRVV